MKLRTILSVVIALSCGYALAGDMPWAKDFAAAQKLAKECVDLDKKVQSLMEGTLKPNIKKAGQATVASANQIDASLAKIEKVIRELKYLAKAK